MKRFKSLRLHEEIMLLALKDKDGTVASGTWSSLALGGAVLAELIGKATKEAVQAVQAAVMVACIMPAVIVSAAAAGR